jgi:hypothetical protein
MAYMSQYVMAPPYLAALLLGGAEHAHVVGGTSPTTSFIIGELAA